VVAQQEEEEESYGESCCVGDYGGDGELRRRRLI
jgi:hypothetical protein